MAESDKVISAVMKATGESYDRVSKLCTIAHETVDECVTDDITVVAPPLVIGRLGCPVLDRLLLRLGDGRLGLLADQKRPFHVELEVRDLEAAAADLGALGSKSRAPPGARGARWMSSSRIPTAISLSLPLRRRRHRKRVLMRMWLGRRHT